MLDFLAAFLLIAGIVMMLLSTRRVAGYDFLRGYRSRMFETGLLTVLAGVVLVVAGLLGDVALWLATSLGVI